MGQAKRRGSFDQRCQAAKLIDNTLKLYQGNAVSSKQREQVINDLCDKFSVESVVYRLKRVSS